MGKKILLILAAGKSSRFGGYPKAFCKLNKGNVIQNTISCARGTYEKIYVAVSKEIYSEYKDEVEGCEVFGITTGHGDAHSLLRAIKYVRICDPFLDKITVCWGDAVIVNNRIFEKTAKYSENLNEGNVGAAICAVDMYPYAWFEVLDGYIYASHFAMEGDSIKQGIHDQSIFVFWVQIMIEYLERYRMSLGIEDNAGWNPEESSEMKLLNAFSFFARNEMMPVQCCMVGTGMVQSFNTRQELEAIKEKFHG